MTESEFGRPVAPTSGPTDIDDAMFGRRHEDRPRAREEPMAATPIDGDVNEADVRLVAGETGAGEADGDNDRAADDRDAAAKARLAAALARIDEVFGSRPAEQVAAFADAQQTLQATLARIDSN